MQCVEGCFCPDGLVENGGIPLALHSSLISTTSIFTLNPEDPDNKTHEVHDCIMICGTYINSYGPILIYAIFHLDDPKLARIPI